MTYFAKLQDSEQIAREYSLSILPDDRDVSLQEIERVTTNIAEGIEFTRELLDRYISDSSYTMTYLLNELDKETESNSDMFEEILSDEFVEAAALRERIA